MVKSFKKYFSFFGILNATASAKINSLLTSLSNLVKIDIPKIMKKLHVSQLKPIKLYSTNKCNTQGKN